jgi:hypothetical protein
VADARSAIGCECVLLSADTRRVVRAAATTVNSKPAIGEEDGGFRSSGRALCSCGRGSGANVRVVPVAAQQSADTHVRRAGAWGLTIETSRRPVVDGRLRWLAARHCGSNGRWRPVDSVVRVTVIRGAVRDVRARTRRGWCLRIFPIGSIRLRRSAGHGRRGRQTLYFGRGVQSRCRRR